LIDLPVSLTYDFWPVRNKNREGVREKSRDGVTRYLPHALVIGTYLLLSAELFSLISRYAVNMLYWDQWDFDDATLFQHHSIWEMFSWQHGPHRLGVGALVQKLIEPWIHWNARYEAFGIGVIIVASAVLALLLKVRLYGTIRYSDVIIPLLFLTPRQYETLVLATNPAHGSLPSLLTIVYCLCWLIPSYYWKYVCLLLVNFLLIYTGFGIFMGLVTPALLALDYYGNIRHLERKYRWSAATALTISIASLGSFFVGYRFDAAVYCFSPAPENPVLYLCFVALMFASVAGLAIFSLKLATLIGSIPLLLLLVCLWIVVKRLLVSQGEDTWPRDAAIAALLAYCAVFCLNTAYGRLCLGLAYAGVSRYTPYVVLGFFGLYLYALSNHTRNARVYLLPVLLVVAVLGARPLNRSDAWLVGKMTDGRRAWRDCYLARHDIHECDTLTHFQIYPHPEATHLQEKLDFLERNRLNLYADSR
jgi:hypothetical protein